MKYFNEAISLYMAQNSDVPHPNVQQAISDYIGPALGHYRVLQFDQPKLEDYRQRIARKGVSFMDFYNYHLPAIRSIFSAAVASGALSTPPTFSSYLMPPVFLCDWHNLWLDSLAGRVSEATIVRYKTTLQKFLLPLLKCEDLRLMDQLRLDKYWAQVTEAGGKQSGFSFHTTVLYGIFDFVVMSSLHLCQTPPAPKLQPKIGALAEQWLSSLPDTISNRTLDEYSAILKKYTIPLLGDTPLSHFTYQQWALYRRKVLLTGCASSTLAKHRAVLNHILDYAVRENLIPNRPEFVMKGAQRPKAIQLPDAASMEQLLRLESDLPDILIVRLAWQMGLTREEIRDLTQRDLNFDAGSALVAGRKVPIPRDLSEALESLPHADGPLLRSCRGKALTSENISMIAKKLLSRHGMSEIRLADLRHDYIIRLLQSISAEQIAIQCGYKDAQTVLRLYREYCTS